MTSKTAFDIEPSHWRHYRPFKKYAEKNDDIKIIIKHFLDDIQKHGI